MMRPLTRQERSAENRRSWYEQEEQEAQASRGDRGAMEFWLRMTRSQVAKEIKAGREDVIAAYALVNRLFMVAMTRRAAGDTRIWNDFMRYAAEVVSRQESGS